MDSTARSRYSLLVSDRECKPIFCFSCSMCGTQLAKLPPSTESPLCFWNIIFASRHLPLIVVVSIRQRSNFVPAFLSQLPGSSHGVVPTFVAGDALGGLNHIANRLHLQYFRVVMTSLLLAFLHHLTSDLALSGFTAILRSVMHPFSSLLGRVSFTVY